MELLSQLNEMQQKAVQLTEGPLLILAGAGSGKTRTIICRIAYILTNTDTPPYRILALTFTNKAAGEMKERICSFGIDHIDEMWMGTFHSVCARILRINADVLGYTRSFSIYDEKDAKKIVSEALDESRLDDKALSADTVAAVISKAKNEALSPQEYAEEYAEAYRAADVAKVYALYQKKLRDNNAMDFDDLLYNTYRLFCEHAEILQSYQNRFRYVLVDEYQDTNKLQYEIVALIAKTHGNICVCGDDDQSIYGWRGADIRNILEFENDFPNAAVIRLEQNYRSTANILQAANALIENNESRKGKTLWTDRGAGELLHIMTSYRDLEEADSIAEEIARLAKQGQKYGDIAILYRVNSQSRILEEGLIRRSIPYQIVRGTRFYERLEVKDILAYLSLAVNPYNTVAFSRALGAPKRGVGPASVEKLMQYASFKETDPVSAAGAAANIPQLSAAVKNKLAEFSQLIVNIAAVGITGGLKKAVETAIKDSGYENALRTSRQEDAEARLDNLSELINAAADFEASSEDSSLSAFLENAALIAGVDNIAGGDGQVLLMTMHNSKGLEFPTVFIAGMEEGLFPLPKAAENPAELEEERRLCYVGMTRAMSRLYLSYAHQRRFYGMNRPSTPSRFLSEIPPELMGMSRREAKPAFDKPQTPYRDTRMTESFYHPQTIPKKAASTVAQLNGGDKIEHPQWGVGTVITAQPSGSDTVITAAFAGLGIKKFILGYTKIKKL